MAFWGVYIVNQIPDTARIVTVSNINNYIKALLSYDINLSGIYVSGEISNFKIYNSGHAYFNLKDAGGLLKCVMFSRYAGGLKFLPKDGMKVLAYGSVTVYERDGVYQLYAERMIPDGMGSLYMAYEALKNKLEQEGLFDSSIKKRIPLLPKVVGVITSESGAVIRDIQNVIGRRFPTMNIKHFHVSVQGENASPEIVKAIKYVNDKKCCDVLIVGRGGGSIEDLWAFNEESTVRAVAGSEIPIISAVGHETDYTLTDFAADLRAPTPSAAAELAVPVLSELKERINEYKNKIMKLPLNNCNIKQMELDYIKSNRFISNPYERIDSEALALDIEMNNIKNTVKDRAARCEESIKTISDHLEALNPQSVLQRGYSIVYDKNGKAVMSEDEVQTDEKIKIQTSAGVFAAKRISDTEI